MPLSSSARSSLVTPNPSHLPAAAGHERPRARDHAITPPTTKSLSASGTTLPSRVTPTVGGPRPIPCDTRPQKTKPRRCRRLQLLPLGEVFRAPTAGGTPRPSKDEHRRDLRRALRPKNHSIQGQIGRTTRSPQLLTIPVLHCDSRLRHRRHLDGEESPESNISIQLRGLPVYQLGACKRLPALAQTAKRRECERVPQGMGVGASECSPLPTRPPLLLRLKTSSNTALSRGGTSHGPTPLMRSETQAWEDTDESLTWPGACRAGQCTLRSGSGSWLRAPPASRPAG